MQEGGGRGRRLGAERQLVDDVGGDEPDEVDADEHEDERHDAAEGG